jgi:hypothetical protein
LSVTIREPLNSGIDATDPACDTVADGKGQTPKARGAAVDVGKQSTICREVPHSHFTRD